MGIRRRRWEVEDENPALVDGMVEGVILQIEEAHENRRFEEMAGG